MAATVDVPETKHSPSNASVVMGSVPKPATIASLHNVVNDNATASGRDHFPVPKLLTASATLTPSVSFSGVAVPFSIADSVVSAAPDVSTMTAEEFGGLDTDADRAPVPSPSARVRVTSTKESKTRIEPSMSGRRVERFWVVRPRSERYSAFRMDPVESNSTVSTATGLKNLL